MSAGKQPGTVIKLTNVSIVRLRKGGKRFEIACYKNTVKSWRTGAQTDLSEVIQIDNIFLNVSKGQLAPAADLQKAFGTTDQEKILMEILKKGELQVGEKERAADLDDLKREIRSEVVGRCVDPNTGRPHTTGMVEKAMNEIGYSINPSKAAKVQALDLIKQLQNSDILPIARAHMRIRLTLPNSLAKKLKPAVTGQIQTIEEDESNDTEWEVVGLIEPGAWRTLDEMVEKEQGKKGEKGRLQMLSHAAVAEAGGDERID